MKIPIVWRGGERKDLKVVDVKQEHDDLVRALSRLDAQYDDMPCKGENSNVCVAEGCYGEACIKSKESQE